jgi:hypothetical protein
MELKFTEIDNNNDSKLESNYEKYWQQEKPKKKKVTFDDILSNMNLVVNKSGVLQYMTPVQQENQYDYNESYNDNYNDNYNESYNENLYQKMPQSNAVKINNNPIDPQVKHSYIYNKYFKEYNDVYTQQEPEIRVPKTIEEYKKMLLEDKIKQNRERIRISQIKSTKLMFTSPNMNTSNVNTRNIQASKNNLRMMNFR